MSEQLNIPEQHSNWLQSKGLQALFDVLEMDGEKVRVNGGAVRNSILGETIGDVDLSTTLLPKDVLQRLKAANIKAIATGLSHGTVTAVIDNCPYEITTLRRDIETDGRHAVVEFGRDWKEDAGRRDLTMNALYCDRHGQVFDPLGGYDDLIARNVRFIGNASDRIKEDYLRILRFFRFFAQYGNGRPDGDGLRACAREKEGIQQLSVERIWAELKKILGVTDPSRALLWMRTTGVLTKVLPESEKWGIDFIGDTIAAETDLDWPIDPISRLQMIMPPFAAKMELLGDRLRLSKREKQRMIDWAMADAPDVRIADADFHKMLYRGSRSGIIDRIKFEIVRQRHRGVEDDSAFETAGQYVRLLNIIVNWEKPVFPLKGKDLEQAGMSPGPDMGKKLTFLKNIWIESHFALDRDELIGMVELDNHNPIGDI